MELPGPQGELLGSQKELLGPQGELAPWMLVARVVSEEWHREGVAAVVAAQSHLIDDVEPCMVYEEA